MSNNDPRFSTLREADGSASALHNVTEGSTPVGMNSLTGLVFRDSAGNLTRPQLLPDGSFPISEGAPGTPVCTNNQTVVNGNTAETDVATLTLTISETYANVMATVSCFSPTVYKLKQIDDATTTVLKVVKVGPGSYTADMLYDIKTIVAGAVGTQELKITGQRISGGPNDFDADLCAVQLA